VLVPMAYSTAEEAPSQTPLTRQCWLSVFSKSPLYPLKLYSDAEVDYDDPGHILEVSTTLDEMRAEVRVNAVRVEPRAREVGAYSSPSPPPRGPHPKL
jgi:hypothetical protein